MKSLPFLVLVIAFLAACEGRAPIYRANVKLLISHSSVTTPTDDSIHEDADRFAATQVDILLSQLLLHRTEQRMNKTPEEVRDNLTNLKATPIRGSDIIVVTVDSPSAGFAEEFANELVSEYLKFRDEQRVQDSENALSPLTHETRRLHEELNAANEKLAIFEKEHGVSTNSELQKLFESREQAQSLYFASLAQLMKADAARSLHNLNVSVLEPAILEPNRVR